MTNFRKVHPSFLLGDLIFNFDIKSFFVVLVVWYSSRTFPQHYTVVPWKLLIVSYDTYAHEISVNCFYVKLNGIILIVVGEVRFRFSISRKKWYCFWVLMDGYYPFSVVRMLVSD